MNQELIKMFDFLKVIEGLKKLERFRGQVYFRDYPQPLKYESVADHTWRMAMILMTIEKSISQKFDVLKTLKMILIHDLPEIIAGDMSALGHDGMGNSKESLKEKFGNEKKAAEELFKNLPKDIGTEFLNLWLEFEEEISTESKIAKAIDKLEARLQVLQYTVGNMFPNHLEFTVNYGNEYLEIDEIFKEFGELINSELKDSYKEFKI